MSFVPVLEIGGSHVTAARVEPHWCTVLPETVSRLPLDAGAAAPELIGAIARCAATLGPLSGTHLRVALPGPFDYATGVGRYDVRVGKFDALNGINLATALGQTLFPPPATITFLNDAAAFTLGEWFAGAGRGADRVVGITLGTGVGSAFLDRGQLIDTGTTVPPQGRVDLLTIDHKPLEETISTRAIIATMAPGTSGVREVTDRARAGDLTAEAALHRVFDKLGRALVPWLNTFHADALIVGGSIAQSWDLLAPALQAGIRSGNCDLTPRQAVHLDTAALIGAAWGPEHSSPHHIASRRRRPHR